jgi:Ser/Thr protein kinase RdoA (MazF antagonist)
MTEHDLSAGGDVMTRVLGCAQDALAAYGGHPAASVELLNVSENATFLVTDPDAGPSVLRVHRLGYHTEPEIASELAWMEALRAEAGVRTPRVLPAADGRRVVTVPERAGQESRHCVRFEFLPGTEPGGSAAEPALTAAHFAELGEITARMHRHAREWDRPAWFTRFHWDYAAAFGDQARWGRWQDGIGVGPAELRMLTRAAGAMADRLRGYGRGEDRFGLIHADVRLANLLADGDDIQVIDFDDCGFGWFMFDVATAVSFIEHDPRVPELCDAWVRGYRRVLPLPAADLAEIPTFVLLRRLQLVAWVGSHRFADAALELGAEFTQGACEIAERYLSAHR